MTLGRVTAVTVCCAALLCTRMTLLAFGLPRTTVLLRHFARRRNAGLAIERSGGADGVVRDVALAAALLPIRARCLEQSLVAHVMLRRHGFDASLRLGVQPYGFAAHAWVEIDGRPVNERSEIIRKLVPFPGSFA